MLVLLLALPLLLVVLFVLPVLTMDLSQVGCACNAALYLVSMGAPSAAPTKCGDYYCDANDVCGVNCPEMDIQEARTSRLLLLLLVMLVVGDVLLVLLVLLVLTQALNIIRPTITPSPRRRTHARTKSGRTHTAATRADAGITLTRTTRASTVQRANRSILPSRSKCCCHARVMLPPLPCCCC